jgi:hypothetical protein
VYGVAWSADTTVLAFNTDLLQTIKSTANADPTAFWITVGPIFTELNNLGVTTAGVSNAATALAYLTLDSAGTYTPANLVHVGILGAYAQVLYSA